MPTDTRLPETLWRVPWGLQSSMKSSKGTCVRRPVSSASFCVAGHAGDFDLVVMGHSIPHKDKEAIFKAVQQTCAAPVIALSRGAEPPLKGAADIVDPMNPVKFLESVERLAASKPNTEA